MNFDADVMMEAFNSLNTNLARLGQNRVPPPQIYNGSTNVGVFFTQFEAYCQSIYGNEHKSWLQILPTFTDGEPRGIVQSFGMGSHITYAMVKERLKAECERRTLGKNVITDFYAASRRQKESLLCYSIRLQSLVGRLTDVPDDHKKLMVRTKFVSCLKPATVTQISIRYGDEDVEFEEVVRLAQLLENEGRDVNFSEPASTSLALPNAQVPSLFDLAAPSVPNRGRNRNVEYNDGG